MIPKLDFTLYLLNETHAHLAQKTGDILSALQNLHDDSQHLGARQILKASQGIVNQIRRVLHDDWPDTELEVLQVLQRIGVALAKAIDENADLKEVIASAVQELERASSDNGEPVNDLGSEGEDEPAES